MLGLTCLECPTQFVSSCQGSRFLSTGPLQDIWRGPAWPIQLIWEKLFHPWFRIHVLQSRCVWRHQWAFLEVNGEPFKRNSPFFLILDDDTPLTSLSYNTWQLVFATFSHMQVGLPRFTFIGSKIIGPMTWLHWSLRHGICFTTDLPNGLSFFKTSFKAPKEWVCLATVGMEGMNWPSQLGVGFGNYLSKF